MTERYWLHAEPRGAAYRALMETVWPLTTHLLLVVRDETRLAESGVRFLERIQEDLVSVERSREWPGTSLYGDARATVSRFRASPRVLETLLNAAHSLYSWTQPELPEDPSLLRDTDEPLLTTMTYEEAAFLDLLPEELELIHSAAPTLMISPDEPEEDEGEDQEFS